MTFTSGDPLTPLAALLNQAVDEGKAYTDSKVQTIETIGWTYFSPVADAGWSTLTCRWRSFGPIVELRLGARYSGATITADSGGDFADVGVFTSGGWPPEILPSDMQYARAWKTYHGVIGTLIQPTGAVSIVDMMPGTSFASGNGVNIKAIYMVG